jgi:hypothetical protein
MDAAITRFNPQYHTQISGINAKLADYLNGGTGLSPEIEARIQERARSRDLGDARRAADAAWEETAGRGFTVPGGAVFSGIRRSRQAASDNLAKSSNEIAIAQALREQANLQWAVGQVASLTNAALSAALSYHGNLVQINGQSLQAAKDVLGAIVESYNLSIRAFEARLGAYKAEADVFDTRLKSAMALRELYESEIRALQAMTTIDQSKIAIYREQINALQALASVYRTRIEAVVSEANVERVKLDLFKSQVEAFSATAQVKESEYRGYSAAINGQESLVKLYSEQVQAHNSVLSGIRLRVDAQSEVVRSQALTNQARATQYKSTVDAFSAIVDARSNVSRTQLENQRQVLNAFEVQSNATIKTAELQSTVYVKNAEIIIKDTTLQIETLIRGAELNLQRARATADLGISSAQQYATVAGSVMSGINTLVAQTQAE